MKNILISIKMLAVVLLLASCSDSYLDVNTDPNNPTTVSPDLILPVAMNYTAYTQQRNRGYNTLGNMLMYNWSQSDGFSWYDEEFQYSVTPSFYAQNFDYTFSRALKQYQVLSTLEGPEMGYYVALGEIMKAYHFSIMVDQYGDIPYSEALQRGSNPTPKYDDAQVISEDLIVKLSAAIALINSTSSNADIVPLVPGADDGLFNGDMDMWKKFANSVKLRILVRQSDMSGRDGYIQTELAKTAADGFMGSDIGINIGYNLGENQMSPFWAAFGTDATGASTTNNFEATCATPFVLNHLMTTNDPRIDFIYEIPASGFGHLGVDQGIADYDFPVLDQFDPVNVSNIGPGIRKSASQDAILMTAGEIHFNLAEASMKGLIGGSPQGHYEAGIQASFTTLGTGSASSYYSQNINLVGWVASLDKMEAIITQKWIALNGINALQSWFDYNRTGFPLNLPISERGVTSTGDRPVRLFYPSSELTTNGINLPAQPNAFTDKIFWAN
ncbi:MAG: SusD/RagB family nutrient-binding outer membrane lipoprotein [Flavobacteriaceae bacterium]